MNKVIRHLRNSAFLSFVPCETTIRYRLYHDNVNKSLVPVHTAIRVKSSAFTEFLSQKFSEFIKWYENVIGLSEVKEHQEKVIEATKKFEDAQENRRRAGVELSNVHNKIKHLHSMLDRTLKTDDYYVQLVSEENQLLKEERLLKNKFVDFEIYERDQFVILSNVVKNSQQKEKNYTERTKYLSMAGWIIGTAIGTLGSFISFHMKNSRNSEYPEILNYLMNFDLRVREIEKILQMQNINKNSKPVKLPPSSQNYNAPTTDSEINLNQIIILGIVTSIAFCSCLSCLMR